MGEDAHLPAAAELTKQQRIAGDLDHIEQRISAVYEMVGELKRNINQHMTQTIQLLKEKEGLDHRVEFYVRRDSYDEETFAVVTACMSIDWDTPPQHGNYHEREFLRRLKRAVTNWMLTTDEGKDAWDHSSEDFNVGDLSLCVGIPKLTACLEGEGIFGLKIQTHTGSLGEWSFDTILAHSGELEEAFADE